MAREPPGARRKLFRRPGHERVDRLGEFVTLVGEEGRRIGEQPVGLFGRLDAEDFVKPFALARVDRRRIDRLRQQRGRIVLGRHTGAGVRVERGQIVDVPVFQNGPGDVRRLFADGDPGVRCEIGMDDPRRGDRPLRRGKARVPANSPTCRPTRRPARAERAGERSSSRPSPGTQRPGRCGRGDRGTNRETRGQRPSERASAT